MKQHEKALDCFDQAFQIEIYSTFSAAGKQRYCKKYHLIGVCQTKQKLDKITLKYFKKARKIKENTTNDADSDKEHIRTLDFITDCKRRMQNAKKKLKNHAFSNNSKLLS